MRPAELCVARLCGEEEAHEARRVPGRDGGGGAVGRARSADRAALSEDWGRRAGGGRFRSPSMLRIYCLQQWYNLSDPGAEEALYDIQSMRAFCGLELGRDAIPDETTILNFRHLLERHELTKAIFAAVAEHLAAQGRAAARRHDRGRDADRGLALDEEQGAASAIPRCRRRRRATSGTSA